MKRILFVDVNVAKTKNSGKGIRIWNLWRRLNKVFDVLYVPVLNDGEELPEWIMEVFDNICPIFVKKDGFLFWGKFFSYVQFLPYYDYQVSNLGKLRYVWGQLSDKVDLGQFDIVISGDFLSGALVEYGRRYMPKALFVWDIVDSFWLIHHRRILLKKRIGFRDRIFEQLFFRYETKYLGKYDYSVLVGWGDIQEHLGKYRDKMIWIPNGVDESFLGYNLSEDEIEENSIIFTGNMSYPPNRDAVIYFLENIWPQILNKRQDINFYIVGKSSEFLKKFEDDNIKVKGYVDDIKLHISKAHVYIAPIRFGGGIKNKVLEALALGKKVVAFHYAVDGFKDIPSDVVALAENDESFSNLVLDLVSQRQKLNYQGISFIRGNYTWDLASDKYRDLT